MAASLLLAVVALRKESVDRNGCILGHFGQAAVALRKESVDRNHKESPFRKGSMVALRKESVDRNMNSFSNRASILQSLSARRAWIEIL